MADLAETASLLLSRAEDMVIDGLPVAMPDASFTPPSDGRYLRVSLFHNAPVWEGLASGRMDQGLLQITVVWPRGRGAVAARLIAQRIIGEFPKGLTLRAQGVRVRISGQPWAGSPILDDAATLVPVTIPWMAA